MTGIKRLPYYFWCSLAGTVLLPAAWTFGSELGVISFVLVLCPPILCLASAQCVRPYPHLAKMGMYCLVFVLLTWVALTVLMNR
jgi:amino acid permease